jgi:Cu-processing system permease protein
MSNREYLEMLVTQPIPRYQVIAGKFLGLLLTLLVATVIGFSVPGILISLTPGTEGASSYAMVILYSMLLGVVFTGCAILLSQIANRRQITFGIAIGVWIFFEIVYGLIMLGATLYLSPAILKSVLIIGLIGNPIDIFRVLSLIAVGGAEFFGPAGATLVKLVGSQWLAVAYGFSALLLWVILPLFLSLKIFSRQNL